MSIISIIHSPPGLGLGGFLTFWALAAALWGLAAATHKHELGWKLPLPLVGMWFLVSVGLEMSAYLRGSRALDFATFVFLVAGIIAAVFWIKTTGLLSLSYRNFISEVETLRNNGEMSAAVGLLTKYRNSLSSIVNHRPFWQNKMWEIARWLRPSRFLSIVDVVRGNTEPSGIEKVVSGFPRLVRVPILSIADALLRRLPQAEPLLTSAAADAVALFRALSSDERFLQYAAVERSHQLVRIILAMQATWVAIDLLDGFLKVSILSRGSGLHVVYQDL